jgi:tetratricopeptide (TPR) repeat protein
VEHLDKVWERIRNGQHAAVIGTLPSELPSSCGFYAVRVSGDGPKRALGPLLEARHNVEQLLGGPLPILDQAAERVWSGLRRRLLGEVLEAIPGSAIVESLNRLHRQSDGLWALVFDSVESADEDSLHLLREMVIRPNWLRVPLLLSFSTPEPEGAAAALLAALTATEGAEVLIHVDPPAEEMLPTREPLPSSLQGLQPEVVAVLRAGAIIGSGFEVSLVAAVLGIEPLRVLELLQRAADLGVLVEDQGDGRFDLPDDLTQGLRASTLPSLAIAWHRMLAGVLSAQLLDSGATSDLPVGSTDSTRTASSRSTGIPVAGLDHSFAELFPSRESVVPQGEQAAEPAAGQPTGDGTAANRATPRTASESPSLSVPQPLMTVDATARTRLSSDLRTTLPPPSSRTGPAEWSLEGNLRKGDGAGAGNEARAASHLVAAGEVENGAARFLAAAREAAAVGGHVQAVSYAREALNLIESLPSAPRRRRLRVMALCELGRLQWEAVGPGGKFTLPNALESLEAARALLEDDDPADLRTTVVTLLASVYYDIGDVRSLEKGLEELTQASRVLLAAGDAVGAARLLNDQAAIYVRVGDPVRASHLLEESRRIFERLRATDPTAESELAETDHLLARLPLHVAARPGREAEAIEMGFRHARSAEAAYQRLGATRELTRVWETIGRLALRGGRLEQAVHSLTAALDAQRELGDVLGLARTTAALAEVMFAQGEYSGALALLGESISLNLEKGSPIGLAYNRRSLEQLGKRLPLEAAGALQDLSRRLTSAEAVLGRIKLPTDLD